VCASAGYFQGEGVNRAFVLWQLSSLHSHRAFCRHASGRSSAPLAVEHLVRCGPHRYALPDTRPMLASKGALRSRGVRTAIWSGRASRDGSRFAFRQTREPQFEKTHGRP
jgi:hypothetical protein